MTYEDFIWVVTLPGDLGVTVIGSRINVENGYLLLYEDDSSSLMIRAWAPGAWESVVRRERVNALEQPPMEPADSSANPALTSLGALEREKWEQS